MFKKILISLLIPLMVAGSMSGTAFAAGPEGGAGRRILYGIVTSVQEGGFTIDPFRGDDVFYRVDENTRNRRGTFSDLDVGEKVGVISKGEEKPVAVLIVLLPPDFEPGGRFAIRARGEVVGVNLQASKFQIQTHDGAIHTFFVDERTRYGGQLDDLSDMQIGWKAAVAGEKKRPGKVVAMIVIAGERPERVRMRGTVTSVKTEAGFFRMETRDGDQATIYVDEETRYGGQLGDLSGLQIGWKVGVGAVKGSDRKLLARWVVGVDPERLIRARGEITAIDVLADIFRLQTPDGREMTFIVDDATRFKGKASSLNDMHVGWKAGVVAVENEEGAYLALFVVAGKPRERGSFRPPEPSPRN